MQEFYSFKEALAYHTHCYVCKSKLEINERDLVMEYDRYGTQRLSFSLSPGSDDILFINMANNHVELVLTYQPQIVYSSGGQLSGHSPTGPSINIYNGKFIHGLDLGCNNCCQFSYTLQIHIDLSEQKLIVIILNSETISIEDNDMVHEIRNVYPLNQTVYDYFSKDGGENKCVLPLVPLDLNNPKETVTRIRKLLIFS